MQDRVASYILTVAMINAGVGVVAALGAWAFAHMAQIDAAQARYDAGRPEDVAPALAEG